MFSGFRRIQRVLFCGRSGATNGTEEAEDGRHLFRALINLKHELDADDTTGSVLAEG